MEPSPLLSLGEGRRQGGLQFSGEGRGGVGGALGLRGRGVKVEEGREKWVGGRER